jgi:MFS family permease
LSILKSGVLLTKRGLLVNMLFFSLFFTSYYVFSPFVLRNIISSDTNRVIIQAAFNVVIALTLIVSSLFIHRINNQRPIYAYSIIASVASAGIFFISDGILRLCSVFLIGVFFSIGQLSFLTYFWESTSSEERGRVAGLIGFSSLLLYTIIAIEVASALDFFGIIALNIILNLGILLVLMVRPSEGTITGRKYDKGTKYYEKRTILLYTVPWLLFSLINATLARNAGLGTQQTVSASFYMSLVVLQLVSSIIGALVGGLIADFFGRRPSLALSVTLYGISTAVEGFVQGGPVLYFVYVAGGLSWGILLAMYSLVVWGDLANKKNVAQMYTIGLAIFYLTIAIGLLPTPLSQISPINSALIGCTLIFLSNMPIVLAPELVSSDFRERIRLKLHIETVKKIKKQSENQG